VGKLARHPLARALRVDLLTVAALEATLRVYAAGSLEELPMWREVDATVRSLRTRARALAADIPEATVVETEAVAGGGALPGYAIPSVGLRLPREDPVRFAARMREMKPPVFGRVEADAVVFDLRAVDPAQDGKLARAIAYALSL
jgi:L-seryl-tRNA(Ser) seleniumtransferase